MVTALTQGGELAVGDADDRGPGGTAIPGTLGGGCGIPGEAEGDDHVLRPHADHFFKHFALAHTGDHMDIVEHIVEVIAQELRQRRNGTNPQDKHPLGLQNRVDGVLKLLPADVFLGLAELFNIGMEDCGNHILVLHPVIGHLNALHGGQAVQHHFLHGLLHAGVAVKAQVHGEPNHRGLGNAHVLGQLVGGHKGRFIIGFQDILGNALLTLGESGHVLF